MGKFWKWYEKRYVITLLVTSTLFILQAFHLYWLFTDIILQKITGHSFFIFPPQGLFIYVFIDYIEIPTHLSLSVLYIYQMQKRFKWRDLAFFIFLQIHWLHIFWITDDVVLNRLTGHTPVDLNAYFAWVAILIDYLEVPIMVDQLQKVYAARKEIKQKIQQSFR